MNLNNSPTKQQLADLLAAADDNAGHNILWVDQDGEVCITLLPEDITPAGFETRFPTTKLRYETFQQGNDYVGPGAAQDESHVARLFNSLNREWASNKHRPGSEYIDSF